MVDNLIIVVRNTWQRFFSLEIISYIYRVIKSTALLTNQKKKVMVRIELRNSYTLVGPESNLERAKKIIADMEAEMKSEYEQGLECGGESMAMDARDDVYWEMGYKETLSEIGFEMEG